MKHKYIYIFYIMILLSAISWRVTRAYPSLSEIKDINISETENQTLVTINLTKQTKIVPYLKSGEKCIVLDFDKTIIPEDLKTKAFASRDVKLGYVSSINNAKTNNDSKKVSPKRVRAKFFFKSDCLPSVKYSDNKVDLKFTVKENLAKNEHFQSNSLMEPNEKKYSPVVVSLEDAPFVPVVSEIASQAGMDLEFKGKVPEYFSMELQSEDPFQAICSIAVKTNMKFYREGKTWYMEGELN